MDGTNQLYSLDDWLADTEWDPSGIPMESLQSTQAGKRIAEEAALESSSSAHRKRRRKEGTVKKIKKKPVIIVPKVPYWQVVKPLKKARSNLKSSRISGKPEIWTSSRENLIKAFPGLKKTTAGLSYINFGEFPTLVWLIEGQGWPEDSWDGKTTIELSIVIEFSDDPFPTGKGSSKRNVNSIESDEAGDDDILSDCSDDEPLASTAKRLMQNYHLSSFPSQDFDKVHHGLLRSGDLSQGLLHPTFGELPSDDALRFDFSPPLPSRPWFSDKAEPLDDLIPHSPKSLGLSPYRPQQSALKMEQDAEHCEVHQVVNCSEGSPQKSEFISVEALPTPSANAFLNVVPEITTLIDCHKNNIPLVVIVNNDSSILPYSSRKDKSVAVLGFFDVAGVEHKIIDNGGIGSRVQVRWTVKLVYTSPEETVGGFQYNTSAPWWLPKTVTGENSSSTTQESAPSPALSLLVDSLEGVPERLWWHCKDCGIVNSRDMFRHRICSHCSKKETTIPAISTQTARVKNKCSPDSFPADVAPPHMTPGEQNNWSNGMRTFCYRDIAFAKIVVKHIFTCNLETLQSQATKMFRRIQSELKLRWQFVPGAIASGPYFSYTLQNKPTEVPPCLKEAGKLMIDYAHNYGDEIDTCIQEFVVLAWETTGTKKGHIFPTKDRAVFVLCLGADADFELCKSDVKHSKEQKAVIAKKGNGERLGMNLIHGDMMIIKGDDFEYSLTRTGTTILVFGFVSAETDCS